ncbi:MAG: glucose-1-phosphate cytidylyltransferase [Anaerolineae bacterium]|nr:glucose-1-phosphate cytidylyltransferase [Anaerolineae bacterium]
MKVCILAGGFGTRLLEETIVRPKPMVEIGSHPILWHIMQGYAAYGFKEFVIALGYKGDFIKDYFINYRQHSQSLTVDLATGNVTIHDGEKLDWQVHLLDTGIATQTGGRVKRLAQYIGDEPFMLTYGDGVSNVNIRQLLEFHRAHGKLATVTAVRPPARFGDIVFEGDMIRVFQEKTQTGAGWINGGFFVLEPGVIDYIEGDDTIWEHGPMERLARENQLAAFRHNDFWQCMDTLRDKKMLNNLWHSDHVPWKVW